MCGIRRPRGSGSGAGRGCTVQVAGVLVGGVELLQLCLQLRARAGFKVLDLPRGAGELVVGHQRVEEAEVLGQRVLQLGHGEAGQRVLVMHGGDLALVQVAVGGGHAAARGCAEPLRETHVMAASGHARRRRPRDGSRRTNCHMGGTSTGLTQHGARGGEREMGAFGSALTSRSVVRAAAANSAPRHAGLRLLAR